MFSTLILSAIFGVCMGYPIYEGTDCLLRNNAIGVCRKIKSCPGGIKLVKNHYGAPSSHIRCGFQGNDPIICCPITSPPPPEENENNDHIVFDYNTGWYGHTTQRTRLPPATGDRTSVTKKPSANIENRIASKQCEAYREKMPIAVSIHIIDGELASEGEFPHMAALGYIIEDELVFDCGGTLISDRYVVTAAHCIINNKRVRPSKVRVGTLNLDIADTTNTDYDVEDITVHPDYKTSSKYHDIALLKLAAPVPFTDTIFPACIYTNDDEPTTALTIAGWGMTEAKRTSRSPVLLKAHLKVLPRSECTKEFKIAPNLQNGITQQQICAVDPQRAFKETRNKDTCQGDSGGPLEMQYKGMATLVGITSFSIGECGSGAPGVYVRISNYLDWIESVVWPTQ